MFTLEQIQLAQKKVKTGEDFPNFIQDLISLGIKGYATIVSEDDKFRKKIQGIACCPYCQ